MRHLVVAALLVFPPAWAQEPASHPFQVRIEGAHEELSRNLDPWKELTAQVTYKPSSRFVTLFGYRETERFKLKDHEGFAAAYLGWPGTSATFHLEGSASPTHRVLARRILLAEVAQPLGSGWVLTVGGKAAAYATVDASAYWIAMEKYVGAFRLAYQAGVARPAGASFAPSHRVTIAWYDRDLTFLSLVLARGRELENIPSGLLVTQTRSVSLSGGLEVTPRFGLLGEVGYAKQGDLYTRRTGRLGTRFTF